MANIRLIHWNASEAAGHIELLRAAGHDVAYDEQLNPSLGRRIRETNPAAVVIDLSRLPSHGREVAIYLRCQKSTRHLPLVFVDGDPVKVAAIRNVLPDATYTTLGRVKAAVGSAIKKPPASPVVPPQIMQRYAGRTTAQKLGIKPNDTVAVFEPPRGYAKVIGELPSGVLIHEEPPDPCVVSVWFAHEPESFLAAIPHLRRLAPRTKLWVAWKKKTAAPKSRLSEDFVRKTAIAAGLVDYKVCAIDATWSGLALAPQGGRSKVTYNKIAS